MLAELLFLLTYTSLVLNQGPKPNLSEQKKW